MSYRTPPIALPNFHDAATQSMITIDNGTISRISIPCFYGTKECVSDHAHDHYGRMMHDHIGWPSPDNPDHSCQVPHEHRHHHHHHIIFDSINLEDEGYDGIEIAFVDPPEGLSAVGTIDYDIVIATFSAMCPDAMDKDIDVQFCIYATGQTIGYPGYEESQQLRDVITKGILHIVSGPFLRTTTESEPSEGE